MKVDISVVIPTYNVGLYIGCMIEALLSQTFKNFEIIIVDDCSTDNTVEILEKYKNDKIRVIKRKENSGGCYTPREDGVMVANGDWIVYLDADDYVESTYLSELFERVNLYKVDVCSPSMIRVDENLKPNGGFCLPDKNFDIDRVYTNREAYNLTVPIWQIGMNGAIVRKSVYIAALNRFRKSGRRTTRSDEILSRVILNAAVNGYVAAKTKYYYRYNPSSITQQFKINSLEWAETCADFIEFAQKEFGKNSKEFRNVLMYDFFCYYSSINQFARSLNDQVCLREGLKRLKKWHKRLKWLVIIRDAKNLKRLIKIILSRFFVLSIILFFAKWKRLSFLIGGIKLL